MTDRLLREISLRTSRSGGRGGQNVNKVETRVELLFNVIHSAVFSPEQKQLVMDKLKNRISAQGILRIIAQSERTQWKNKRLAIQRFLLLMEKCIEIPVPRKPGKPSRATVERRLKGKRNRKEIKESRRKVNV